MKRDLLGHPRGLVFLFSTEMWERFSYYGNRVLLPVFLLQYLLLPGHRESVLGFEGMRHALALIYGTAHTNQQLQSEIYGAYTALVYFAPLVGGFLADRWFGRRYSVVAGGILMSIGHFLMTFDNYFYVALLFLILGNGGFKANISVQVGGLYRPGDHRIDRAYSVFYVGTNLGALLGQIICGYFGDYHAWRYGFGAAGIAMLTGTIVYLFALRVLDEDRPRRTAKAAPRAPLSREDWRAILILVLFFIPGSLFWATYEQSGNTMEVWSVDHVNRAVSLGFMHFSLSIGVIQSFNSVFIIAFTPLLVWYWKSQEETGSEPRAVVKMALGFVILALSYFILAGAQAMAGAGQVHWLWTLLYFAVYTVGELYFSPVGLSLYSKAAPPQVGALMMAVFLGTSFLGNYLAGWLGTFYSVMSSAQFFFLVGAIALAPAPVIWAFDQPLKAIMAHRDSRRAAA
jgi:POT family proton-dependent oligopeptide transporter